MRPLTGPRRGRATLLVGLVGLVLAVSGLTGCGGSDASSSDSSGPTQTETYCKDLKADKAYFSAFGSGDMDPGKFSQALDKFHALADAAPDDIAPQWDTLDGALTEVQRTLAEAGISTEDLAGLQSGKLPKGVDMSKLAGLATKLKQLNSPELQTAAKKIQQHAKKECGVDLAARTS
jgi:hypothetical protein